MSQKKSKLTCRAGLVKDVIKSDVFDREIALCKELSKNGNGSCGWGRCKECGVLPLLYKLHKGVLLEDEIEIKDIKKDHLNFLR